MIFISYKPGSKVYCLWDPRSHKIIILSDVNFDEASFPNKPEEKPVVPPTMSECQDLVPVTKQNKKLEGKKKAITIVNVPEVFFLEDEERNQLLPPWARFLGPQPHMPLPPPLAPILPPALVQLVLADLIPPVV